MYNSYSIPLQHIPIVPTHWPCLCSINIFSVFLCEITFYLYYFNTFVSPGMKLMITKNI